MLSSHRLVLFPRIVVDYFRYTSATGGVELDIDELLSKGYTQAITAKIGSNVFGTMGSERM